MMGGHVVDCGAPGVKVHKLGALPGKRLVNATGPVEGNVSVGTDAIWIGLGPRTPIPPASEAAGVGTLSVCPGDGVTGPLLEDVDNGADEDCPGDNEVDRMLADGPVTKEVAEEARATAEVVELLDGNGRPDADALDEAGGIPVFWGVLKAWLAWELDRERGGGDSETDMPLEMDAVVEVDRFEETIRIDEFGSSVVPTMLPEMGGIPGLADTVVVELLSVVDEEPGAQGAVPWLALGRVDALESGLTVKEEAELAVPCLVVALATVFDPGLTAEAAGEVALWWGPATDWLLLVGDSAVDSGLEGWDKRGVVDDPTGPGRRGILGTTGDGTVLERVDGGGAGTLDAEEDELVADTLEVMDGASFWDIEVPVTGPGLGDVWLSPSRLGDDALFRGDVEQSFGGSAWVSVVGSVEESSAGRVEKSWGGRGDVSCALAVPSVHMTEESFAGHIESFAGVVVVSVELVAIELPDDHELARVESKLLDAWKGTGFLLVPRSLVSLSAVWSEDCERWLLAMVSGRLSEPSCESGAAQSTTVGWHFVIVARVVR
jgi:hypothetical protein